MDAGFGAEHSMQSFQYKTVPLPPFPEPVGGPTSLPITGSGFIEGAIRSNQTEEHRTT
jgi:hypothetical protein